MKRRAFLRWTALAPVAAVAAPLLAKASAVASRVAPRVPRIEWVLSTETGLKSLVIDHAEVARFLPDVRLAPHLLAYYVRYRDELARATTEALRLAGRLPGATR